MMLQRRPLLVKTSIRRSVLVTGFALLTFLSAMPARLTAVQLSAAVMESESRPNILWITSEDNASHWLGCYGNPNANTPRLDAFAKSAIRFSRAYANAPVCAVARSTLLTGVHAVTLGTQHMRSRYPIDPRFRPYVSYLREQGYYCTNNAKTDFNIQGNDKAIWDACSGQAHYQNRPPETPFFSIFNLTVSHESSLFPQSVKRNRERQLIPEGPSRDPQQITIPPYLPDLPEIRNDFAIYHDVMTALDTQVGRILDELDASGLAEDTIVFYFADHGGPTPRGKRYLEDTGTRVPLLIRIPEKFQHLTPFSASSETDELVSFVDFAPTLLSLLSVQPSEHMQGRPFLGPYRTPPQPGANAFLYADRFDERVGMRRGITDGRFKYIRQFTPHLPGAPYSYYPLSIPGWVAWQQAASRGELSALHARYWETPQPLEFLFDLENDPWEIDNLANDPAYRDTLLRQREQLQLRMVEFEDSGILAEGFRTSLVGSRPVTDWIRVSRPRLPELVQLAFDVHTPSPNRHATISQALQSPHPEVRYWGLLGVTFDFDLEEAANDIRTGLEQCLADPEPTNRIMAARILHESGDQSTARRQLSSEIDAPLDAASYQLLMNTIADLQCSDLFSDAWIEETLSNPQADEGRRRMAARLKQERQ